MRFVETRNPRVGGAVGAPIRLSTRGLSVEGGLDEGVERRGGSNIVYRLTSFRGTNTSLLLMSADGSGDEDTLLTTEDGLLRSAWSADEQFLGLSGFPKDIFLMQ